MSLLLTAVISAGVAGVVTLIIEYAAKPRLEVRKDRILESERIKRDACRGVENGSFLIGRLLAYADGTPEPVAGRIESFATEAIPIYEDIVTWTVNLSDELSDGVTSAAAHVFALCMSLQLGGELDSGDWKSLEDESDVVSKGAEYLKAGWWKRRKVKRELIELIENREADE